MHIVHVASEMAPLAKAGGLADVVGGLSTELSNQNFAVSVILPKYKCLNEKFLKNLQIVSTSLDVEENSEIHQNTVWSANFEKVKVILIEPHHPDRYFARDNIYDYEDDISRFLYFCKCAFQYLTTIDKKVDVLHLHDWHTAILAPLFRDPSIKQQKKIKKVVFTIHNLCYQGKTYPSNLDKIALDGKYFLTKKRLQDNRAPTKINLLKGAIVYSDIITTVSPNYAKEILHKSQGAALDATLRQNKHKLFGVLNGIDAKIWNPKNDHYLASRFSAKDSIETILQAKRRNKEILRKRIGLANKHLPLVSNIGRLVSQKSPALIYHAILRTIEKNGQFVLLAGAPDKKTEKKFLLLKKKLKNNKNVYIHFGHSEELAHLLYAASDFIIVPSRFEPCGLTQIIAMRYGTIPIVRRTGGLADTVFDLDKPVLTSEKPNGFTFDLFSAKGINSCLDRAIDSWHINPKKIYSVTKRIMKIDYSWKKSAKRYIELYLSK